MKGVVLSCVLFFYFAVSPSLAVIMNPTDAQALSELNAAFKVHDSFSSWDNASSAVCNGEAGAWEGITCNANGRVTAISPGIPVDRPAGVVPDSFGNLTALETWVWPEWTITAPLPTTIAQLTNLQVIDLSKCGVTGGFPSFSSFPNLTMVLLAENRFDRDLFPLSSVTNLPNLMTFAIDGALDKTVSGPLPSFTNLPSLSEIKLSSNNFTEPIPAGFLSDSTQATRIQLTYNGLTGPLPSLGASNRWTYIDLGFNKFEGSIPTNWKDFDNLTTLWIDQNRLTGGLPRLPSNLVEFHAHLNWLMGNVSELASLPKLATCEISSNWFDTCPDNFTVCCSDYHENSIPPPPTATATSTLTTATTTASTSSTLLSSSLTSDASTATSSTLATATASTTMTTSNECSGGYVCTCSSNLTSITNNSSITCQSGIWKINGVVSNGDTVIIAQGDQIILNGSLTQLPQATLQIVTNGSAAGTIKVQGEAQLGGTLVIVVTSHDQRNFTVPIINATALNGKFSNIEIRRQFQGALCYKSTVQPTYTSTSFSVLITQTKKSSCNNNKGRTIGIAVGATLGAVFILLIIAIIIIIVHQRNKKPERVMVFESTSQSVL